MAIIAHGQNEEDALRLASMRPGGTARSAGMANAFGALGADPASASINPAGMAFYRANSLSLTLGVDVVASRAGYYGTSQSATVGRAGLPNLALVMHVPGKEGGLRSSTYGLVYDRIEQHRSKTDALGDRVPSTMLQRFVNLAAGTAYDDIGESFPFDAGLAWDAFGIDTLPGSINQYFPYIPFGSMTKQRHVVDASGGTTRTGFFYAANLDDRIHLGAQASVIGHRFSRTTTHTEYSLDPNLALGQFDFEEKLVTSGSGFELSFGALFRLNDRWRAGAVIQSPQWMSLSDAYSTRVRTGFRDTGQPDDFDLSYSSPDGSFSYRVTTPWRATASAAYIAGKNGLVSFDYEYADLPSMRFRRSNRIDDDYDFTLENAAIGLRSRPQHTVRVGTEWRFGNWYVRGGCGYIQDPYQPGDRLSGQARRTFATGGGYRGEHVSVDFAANYMVQGIRAYAYDPDLVEPMEVDRRAVAALLTFSFRP